MKEPEKRIGWKDLLQHPWIKPDLPILEIPAQPHFEFYLEAKKLNKKKVDIVRMSQNMRKNEINEYQKQNINTDNRRDELDFGEDNIDCSIDEEEEDRKEIEERPVKEEQPEMPLIKHTDKSKKRPSVPQVDDSANLNLEVEKISKNSLTPMD